MNLGTTSIELTSILYSSNRNINNESLSLQQQQLTSVNRKLQSSSRRQYVTKSTSISVRQEQQPSTTNNLFLRSSTPKSTSKVIAQNINELSRGKAARLSSSWSPTQTPRCSTPLYSKQRRTRPFIACELCRRKAFMSVLGSSSSNNITTSAVQKKNSTFYCRKAQHQNYSKLATKKSHPRTSIDQLLVWIL
ncbi:unnamed protein product [Didymodactylos carnosus]|uniref:Uncharacterized protein n=1 Tax=Didymodactylos carnosus TaxID=1234261 RepID=A0A813QKL0_9BILA|nr:unnamed protein product [Didymodactylos carnosus]CAF1205608.1 unnamed protein product [Didymodactylos carnosus]CAF3549681.1 unnamed protein product [Didymodactylos carnosus]CAF4015081.1 unnamed protein product [Didymodactylos carnosus]